MASTWNTYRVWAKSPGGSWEYLGAESATSKTHAIKQFRSGFPRGTRFKAAKASESREERVNPRRKITKTQKKAKAARSRKKSLKARAVHTLLRIMNPAGIKKVRAVRVKRLKGGGVSILPVKAVKR